MGTRSFTLVKYLHNLSTAALMNLTHFGVRRLWQNMLITGLICLSSSWLNTRHSTVNILQATVFHIYHSDLHILTQCATVRYWWYLLRCLSDCLVRLQLTGIAVIRLTIYYGSLQPLPAGNFSKKLLSHFPEYCWCQNRIYRLISQVWRKVLKKRRLHCNNIVLCLWGLPPGTFSDVKRLIQREEETNTFWQNRHCCIYPARESLSSVSGTHISHVTIRLSHYWHIIPGGPVLTHPNLLKVFPKYVFQRRKLLSWILNLSAISWQSRWFQLVISVSRN